MNKITLFLFLIFTGGLSKATEMGVPIQLKLKNPEGIYPSDNNAHFTVQILSPSNGCVLREEDFENQVVVSGTISLALGSGNRAGYDPNLSLAAVYDNSAVKNNLTCVDANNNVVNSGQSYNPASSDTRILRVRATVTGVPIVVNFTQRAAPYAIHAESVGGKVASDLLAQNGATSLNQANLETLLLNATRFNKLQNLAINGAADTAVTATTAQTATNFSGSVAGDVTGTQSATTVAAIRGVGVVATAPTAGQVLAYNGSQYAPTTLSVSAPVSSVNGKTGAVVLTVSDIAGLASAVNTVNAASAISSADTLALRDSSGNLAAAGLTATGASLKNIYLYENTNANRVEVRAPNSFANYTLVLPTTDGNSGEMLQTDGSGNLSWGGGAAITSAAVTSALGFTPAANNDSRLTGALQQTTFNTYVASANCSAGQSMYWNSVSSTFLCQNITVSGDISGSTSSATVAKIQGVGVSFTALANNHLLQYNGTNFVNRVIPSCSANQYLTFNGTAWSCATDMSGSGGVSAITVVAPLQSTGGLIPTLSLAQATASASGYLTATDWATFNNKITSSAASIAQVLGYTPANNTAVTLKANNLSDLTSSATARTNLGLGTLATANSVDLSSANATGTLAIARLPAMSGDISSADGSNSLTVTKLQGVDVNSAAPTAGQMMVFDGTKWTPTTDPVRTSRKTSDQVFSSTTVANVTSMSFAVVSGVTYKFKFNVLFSSANTATGAKFGLASPSGTLAATAYIPLGGDGIDSIMLGHLTSSGDTVTGTGVQTANTVYYGYVEGVLVATATGTLQLTVGSETGSAAITIKAGSHGEIQTIP